MGKGFQKGYDERRNLAGRPQGSSNKDIESIRKKLRIFLYDKLPELPVIYKALRNDQTRPGAKEQFIMIEKLMRHVLPPPTDELMRLSDADLDKLIEKLKTRVLDNSWHNKEIKN
jgi:hypothetical protein